MRARSPHGPYGVVMQDADLVHFTTTVGAFHQPAGDRGNGRHVRGTSRMDRIMHATLFLRTNAEIIAREPSTGQKAGSWDVGRQHRLMITEHTI